MGFNIAGIAFDANYENEIETLEAQIRFKLENKKTVTFEDVSRNWWDEENKIGVAFAASGTLVFCSPDLIQDHITSPLGTSFGFAMIDTSDAYAFYFAKRGTILRDVMVVQDTRMTDEGDRPKFETHENPSESIWAGLEAVLGQPFSQFPLEQTAYIFDIRKPDERDSLKAPLEKTVRQEDKSPPSIAPTIAPEPKLAKQDLDRNARLLDNIPKRPSFLKRLFGRGKKPATLAAAAAAPKEAAQPSPAEIKETVRRAMLQYPERQENFLDQILKLCQADKNVEKAYLALQSNSKTARHEYILGFEFSGKDEAMVKSMSRVLKEKFFTERELYYCSNITDPDLFETVKAKHSPFFVKYQYYQFRELLTHWGLDRHRHAKAVELTIRTTPIAFFATHKTDFPDDDDIIFPQDGSHMVVLQDKTGTQPFVPIFTDAAAAQASQYPDNADGIFLIEMSIPDFNSVTRGVYKGRNFILNASESPMEFFFKL